MLDTPWRRLAATLFDAPHSGRILVRIEVDAEPVEAHLAATPGAQRAVGFLPFVAAAAARAVAEDVPALNGYLQRGRVRARDGVTVSITAPVPGQGGLLALPLRDAHVSSATALASTLRAQIRGLRDRAKRGPLAEYLLAGLPWPLRHGVFRAARGLAHLGVPMARFDLAPESYGALVVTSMEPVARGYDHDRGAFTEAFVPLFPAARNASLVAVLPPREMPAAVGGEVVVRRRAVLCFTFDHRLVDGLEVGAFIQSVHRRLLDPSALDRSPDSDS